MVIIETDIIIALASKEDKHHSEVVRFIEKVRPLKLSPYALIELDLLIKSKAIIARLPDFYDALNYLIYAYNITILNVNAKHFVIAYDLRNKYNLTYFDSLHAATAIESNEILVSYDKLYEKVRELRYTHPTEYLRSD